MTRATDPVKLDHAIALYSAGKSTEQAAATVGISISRLGRALKARGLTRSRRIDVADAVEAYLAGEAVLSIAKRHSVDRAVIDRHLTEAGVTKRSPSEQCQISAARQSPDERRARAAAAHAAVRGKPRSAEAKRRTALVHQSRAAPQSRGERLMLAWLQERGCAPGIQTAVEHYNVDFTVAGVAVEVLGGEWHASKPRHRTRTKKILDAGWHVLFVWDTPTFPITPAAADYAIAFAQEASGNPAAIREYRVIRGDGDVVASGRADTYDLALVPPARHGCDIYEVSRRGLAARWANRDAGVRGHTEGVQRE